MRFDIVTLFPELFAPFFELAIVGKAAKAGTIRVRTQSPRDFAVDKHGSTDDTPYGGGHGMVMRPGPILDALEALDATRGADEPGAHRVLLTPQGARFTQATARRFATDHGAIALVCGRYEGFDERVRAFVDEELSIGDFVMTGGEVAAMCVIEAVARLVPGVLGNLASTEDESHAAGLIEYPQYTRPPVFRDMPVPPVLLSGDHAKIARWRRDESLRRTHARRPDLWSAAVATETERAHVEGREPPPLRAEASLAEQAAMSADSNRETPPTDEHAKRDTPTDEHAKRDTPTDEHAKRDTPTDEHAKRDTPTDDSTARDATPRVYCALIHFPVRDRNGDTVTSAVTNIDVHDLARSSRTYGLRGFFVVTPITAQRALVTRILEHWDSPAGVKRMPERGDALSICASAASVDEVLARITEREGSAPRIVTTSARAEGGRRVHSYAEERAAIDADERATLILFGTGHGLQKVLVDRSDALLAPIRPRTYNHLSVRAAAAITLDRLFGDGP